MSIGQTLRALLRMRWPTLALFALLAGLGVAAVASRPLAWTSAARIAIERPDGTLGEARADDQELLYQRIDFLRSSILAKENLERTALETGYADGALSAQAAAALRRDITERLTLEVENTSVVNQYTGKLGLLPLAIRVAFEADDPERAHAMTVAITEQVLSFNRGRENSSSRYRNEFLAREVEQSASRLEGIEQRIADFKEEHALLLPDLRELTVKRIEEVDAGLARSRDVMADLEQSVAQSEAEIATTSPEALLFAPDGTRIESAVEKLDRLRLALSASRARYSDEHPEVVRLAGDVRALEAVTGSTDTRTLEVELAGTTQALARARTRYATDHPEVQRLERESAALTRTLAEAGRARRAPSAPRASSVPSSPAYNRLLARRQSLASAIARERARGDELAAERDALAAQLQAMPAVEREYLALTRLLESESEAHAELVATFATARLDAGLREADLLETLTLVEPPSEPLTPSSPNKRLLYALVLLAAALVALTVSLARVILGDTLWEIDGSTLGPGTAVNPIPVF